MLYTWRYEYIYIYLIIFIYTHTQRIHVWYIYANIGGILMGSMLPYIAYMDPMGYDYNIIDDIIFDIIYNITFNII